MRTGCTELANRGVAATGPVNSGRRTRSYRSSWVRSPLRRGVFTIVCAAGLGSAAGHEAAASSGQPPCGYEMTIFEGPEVGIGTVKVFPYAMNNHGEVVGKYSYLGGGGPFYWSKETGPQLMGNPPGATLSWGIAINDNGWILVYGSGNLRGYIVPPEVRFAPSQWIRIDPVGRNGLALVRGINSSNQVVGERSAGSVPHLEFYPSVGFLRHPDGTIEDIVIEGGGPSCGLYAINDSGAMLGWTSEGKHWHPTTIPWLIPPASAGDRTPVALSTPTATQGIMPMAMNQAGDAVVIEQLQIGPGQTDIHQTAYLFGVDGTVCELPPAAGEPWSNALTLNDDLIVGGKSRTLFGDPVGTLWFDGVPVDVSELVDVPPAGTVACLTAEVMTVNAHGQVLCQLSCSRGLILTPIDKNGDIDCDGVVGPLDLAVLLSEWGGSGTRADLDGDGVVNGADLGLLLAFWEG